MFAQSVGQGTADFVDLFAQVAPKIGKCRMFDQKEVI